MGEQVSIEEIINLIIINNYFYCFFKIHVNIGSLYQLHFDIHLAFNEINLSQILVSLLKFDSKILKYIEISLQNI